MGTQKKTRKFAQVSAHLVIFDLQTLTMHQVKRIIGRRDARLKENQAKQQQKPAASASSEIVREM
jgi:hypothetical protein